MATSQYTRRRRASTARPPARRRRRNVHAGWYAAGVLVLFVAARTWPLYTGLACGLAVASAVAAVVLAKRRPHRTAGMRSRIGKVTAAARIVLPQRSAVPARRTVEGFYALKPGRFEEAIRDLALEDDDTAQATVVGGSGDGGMDVRVLRSDGSHVLVQCKRYRKGGNVPARDIRDANGAYWDVHRCHRAVIVTTADFTKDAKATNTLLRQQVRLVNGAALTAWANGGPSPLS
ncbi:restriction endonuclease [Streptomyces sp. NPDC102364]|uniref:restriction endonuclease n=1 Tax=Streptomyces sp. NPDC102364 TaxID=3366161 RepID=UPI0037FDD0DC